MARRIGDCKFAGCDTGNDREMFDGYCQKCYVFFHNGGEVHEDLIGTMPDDYSKELYNKVCLECGKVIEGILYTHINYGHKITVAEYKEKYGFTISHTLMSKAVRERKRKAVRENNTIRNILNKDNGHRFKKGSGGNKTMSRERLQKLRKGAQNV